MQITLGKFVLAMRRRSVRLTAFGAWDVFMMVIDWGRSIWVSDVVLHWRLCVLTI